MIPAEEALKRLRDGNKRYVDARMEHNYTGREELMEGQHPFAVILGCSDSRVPAEIVFDQGLGDLFVIRVAGNIVAPSQVGSVEFAVSELGSRLVVVMGHTLCGAVNATLGVLGKSNQPASPNLASIVDRIRPSVETLCEMKPDASAEELMGYAVRANVRASVNHLRQGSAIIENAVRKNDVLIVGAEYCLESGVVDFFDFPRGE